MRKKKHWLFVCLLVDSFLYFDTAFSGNFGTSPLTTGGYQDLGSHTSKLECYNFIFNYVFILYKTELVLMTP